MVDRNDLENTLQLIFENHASIKKDAHRCLAYWKQDHNASFIIEEYAPSQTLVVDGKEYDPTMRIFFLLSHYKGTLTLNPLAGYWKIPVQSLTDQVSLTECHITKAYSGSYFTGRQIPAEDLVNVREVLKTFLLQFYESLLNNITPQA